jgi:hypothetical protein
VAVADLNGDGKLDVVVVNSRNNTVGTFLNKGDGTFGGQHAYGGGAPVAVALGDLNGDARPDIVVANYSLFSVGVLMNKGDGTFDDQVTFSTGDGSFPAAVGIGDLNGDHRPDIVVANGGSGTIGVLLAR